MINDPEKIRHLYHLGHEIAAHTCTHPDLTSLTLTEIEREIVDSKRKLEEITKNIVKGFAYPFSYHNRLVVTRVKEHFEYARCGTIPKNPWNIEMSNRYLISSIGVKKLLTLALYPQEYKRGKNRIRLTIMIHDMSIVILASLVHLLRFGFRANFVTANEIANMIILDNNSNALI
jgi:peptidoglycan/xylan/chitin deacetylase (PgdA/CDA1 family)